jgi:hypothetical protein
MIIFGECSVELERIQFCAKIIEISYQFADFELVARPGAEIVLF